MSNAPKAQSDLIDELITDLENEYDPNAVRERMNKTTLKSAIEKAMNADGNGQVIFLTINKDGEIID